MSKAELLHRIEARLTSASDVALTIPQIAAVVTGMFYSVSDEWESLEATTLGTDGQTWIEQRWLVCRIPVQTQEHKRVADRTVKS